MTYEVRLTRGASPLDPGPRPILWDEVERALSQTGIVLEEPATGEEGSWVRYGPPFSAYKAGELWFRMALVGGVVSLSASYSSPRVFRNVTDMTNNACWPADELGARAIEPGDVAITPSAAKLRVRKRGVEEIITYRGGRELVGRERPEGDVVSDRVLTADALPTLWEDPAWKSGKWAAHDASIVRINERAVAAVEVPIGGLDLVPDFASSMPAMALELHLFPTSWGV